MIPFLHLGPLTIPTFGLMVALGLLAAAYLLQADFDRRREQFVKSGYQKRDGKPSHHDEGFLIIGIAGLAGLGLPGSADSLPVLWCSCFWRAVLEFRPLNSWTYVPRQRRLVMPSGASAACCPGTATTAGPHRGPGPGGWLFPTASFPLPKPVCNGAGRPTAAFTRLPFMNFSFGWPSPRSCGTWARNQ